MPKYYLLHGDLDPLEIECSEETADWIRSVMDYLDESCGNCLNYPCLTTEEDYADIMEARVSLHGPAEE
jgi:hypothetical protein